MTTKRKSILSNLRFFMGKHMKSKVFFNLKTYLLCVCISHALPALSSDIEMNNDKVLLTVGAVSITSSEVIAYMRDRLNAGTTEEAIYSSNGLRQSIENVMVFKVLAKQAEDAGIKFDEQMEQELALHKQKLLSQALLREEVRKQAENTNWELLAKEEYLADPDQFKRSEEVTVSHILVETKNRSEEAANNLITKIQEQIKSGEDFGELASLYSDDPSVKTNRGNLGSFPRGKMVREFDRVAFSMQNVGDISEPVRTQFGFHILKLEDKTPARNRSFDEVKTSLIAQQKRIFPDRVRDSMQKNARAETIKMNEDALHELEDLLKKQTLSRN